MHNFLSQNSGTIHIIGIGGIGMSGLAQILNSMNIKVQGSDMKESLTTQILNDEGVKVFIGQKGENVENADIIVKSTAIKDSNPEIIAAKEKGIKILKRSQLLAAILQTSKAVCISGSHGKTTTTSMVYTLFQANNIDPTVINGGIINSIGTNAKPGKDDWIVAESDESDGTFIELPAHIGVVTNIDAEHLEHYGSYEKLLQCFKQFVDQVSKDGFCVICADDDELKKIAQDAKSKLIKYSIDCESDVRAVNIRAQGFESIFDVEISDNLGFETNLIKDITLPFVGKHNILNCLSAICVGVGMNFKADKIKSGFDNFQGVKRRFTKAGIVNGVTIIDDYAHHPKEVAATLEIAKQVTKDTDGDVIAVVQPHRYTRLRDVFAEFATCFDDADKVIITDIYAAGEEPINGYSKESLVKAIEKSGHKNVQYLKVNSDLANLIKDITKSDDIVICMGAGDITTIANNLPNELKKLEQEVA